MFQFTNHFTSLYYKSNLAKNIDFSKIEKEKLIHCIPQKKFFDFK